MSSLVHYEGFVDHCADIFIERLNEFADKRQSLNLGHWLQCYAFDVIGNITFGERFGKLDPTLRLLSPGINSLRLPGPRS